MEKVITLRVDPGCVGQRLDVFLAAHVVGLTRSQAKRLVSTGRVASSGRPLKPAAAVGQRQEIVVRLPEPRPSTLVPEPLPLDILYEDDDIVVINKCAGMVVHPAAGNRSGTLVHALLAHCRSLSGIGGEQKPGIVHRLDKGTSGVIVAAKNDAAHLSLTRQFAAREVTKVYRALVSGELALATGTFDAPLGRARGDRKKFSSRTRKGRSALTRWRVRERLGKMLTWVEVELHTGRTHQIRVHFSEAGHPLVGDVTYGARRWANRLTPETLRAVVMDFGRPALHAERLGFRHPRTGVALEFRAPLPADLRELLKRCHVSEGNVDVYR